MIQIYEKRTASLASKIGFGVPLIAEVSVKKNITGEELKKAEAEILLKNSQEGEILIALDEKGVTPTSQEFAALLTEYRDSGVKSIRFLIGGADGLHTELLQKAHKKIAFGKMTLPHKLARVLLYEQIYRAFTLIAGLPYHKS